jgi:tRNA threonylcarbamoyladenosine biosynthesis protein TsaE
MSVTQVFESASTEETRQLGKRLGALLKPGDFVGLSGQLGAGKTLFARAIAEGLGVDTSDVSSPTFSIVQTYKGRVPLHHVDLYRLESLDELTATGFFDLEPGVLVVEWAEKIPKAIPADALRLSFSVLGESQRQIDAGATGDRHKALLAVWALDDR